MWAEVGKKHLVLLQIRMNSDVLRMNSGVLRVARGSSGAKAPPLAARPENAITRLPRAPKTQLPEKSTARIGV